MTITDSAYFSAALGLVTLVATIALLWWLYRYTRLKPALYYLFWHVLSAGWGLGGSYLYRKTITFGHGQGPRLNVYVFAALQVVSVVGTVLFLWLLVSLARWGRARLPAQSAVHIPIA